MSRREQLTNMQDEQLDLLLQQALAYEEQAELDELLAMPDEPLSETEAASAKRRFAQIWRETQQAQRPVGRVRRIMMRLVEAAACVILAIAVTGVFAVASSEAVREELMQLLISFDEQGSTAEVSFIPDPALTAQSPKVWRGYFYPAHIPDGYEVASCKTWAKGSHTITLVHPEGGRLQFSESTGSASATYDVAASSVYYVEVGETLALVRRDGSRIALDWTNGVRWFSLEADGVPYDEILRVAGSVRLSLD